MNIQAFKLITGEEVVADFTGAASEGGVEYYNLEKPRLLMLQDVGNGRIGMIFMPWLHANFDASVKLSSKFVICAHKPSDEIEQGYLEKTSGLTLAKGSSLLKG